MPCEGFCNLLTLNGQVASLQKEIAFNSRRMLEQGICYFNTLYAQCNFPRILITEEAFSGGANVSSLFEGNCRGARTLRTVGRQV